MILKIALTLSALGFAWLTYKVYRLMAVTPAGPPDAMPSLLEWCAGALMVFGPPAGLIVSIYYLYKI